jgi:hypothetical protein
LFSDFGRRCHVEEGFDWLAYAAGNIFTEVDYEEGRLDEMYILVKEESVLGNSYLSFDLSHLVAPLG